MNIKILEKAMKIRDEIMDLKHALKILKCKNVYIATLDEKGTYYLSDEIIESLKVMCIKEKERLEKELEEL